MILCGHSWFDSGHRPCGNAGSGDQIASLRDVVGDKADID